MNKKTPIALISGLVLIVILVIVALSYKEAGAPVDQGDVPDITETANNTKTTIIPIDETSDSYAIDVEYPTIGSDRIDQTNKAYVEREISVFKKNIEGSLVIPGRQNLLTIKVLDVYRDDEIVSVTYSIYTDTGGAHGLGIITGKNFATSNGQELFTEDALQMTGETLWSLSEKATAHFETEIGEALFRDGLSPQTENFKSFTINDDQVTFHFSPYQIAAYTFGPQEFSLPRVDE